MNIANEYESNLEGEGINIVPMIDVIFAILTFFIISSLDLIRLDNIPVNLPKNPLCFLDQVFQKLELN